jgi:hypothetical protein
MRHGERNIDDGRNNAAPSKRRMRQRVCQRDADYCRDAVASSAVPKLSRVACCTSGNPETCARLPPDWLMASPRSGTMINASRRLPRNHNTSSTPVERAVQRGRSGAAGQFRDAIELTAGSRDRHAVAASVARSVKRCLDSCSVPSVHCCTARSPCASRPPLPTASAATWHGGGCRAIWRHQRGPASAPIHSYFFGAGTGMPGIFKLTSPR